MALSDTVGLIFSIKANGDQAVDEINKVRKAEKDLETSTGAASSGFAAMAGPATIAAAGIAAVAASAAAVGASLYSAAKAAADFGSEIFDAHQKTGLSAKSLSGLKFAADQAGSSFEQITKGIVMFGIELGKVAEGDEKAADKMKALGVTSTDLQTALGEVFKTISDAKTPTEQLALATEAFGKKIGPDLIPLIKDANGNFDALIANAEEFGFTITDDAMVAADAFGDTMATLDTQMSMVKVTIGNELIPVILDLAREFSTFLKDNKTEIKGWGEYIADSMRRGILSTKAFYTSIQAVGEAMDQLLKPSWERDFTKFWELVQKSESLEKQRALVGSDIQRKQGGLQQGGEVVMFPGATTPVPGLAPSYGKTKLESDADRKAAEEAKKAAEKRRKDREAAYRQENAAQSAQLQILLRREHENYDARQKILEDRYLKDDITEKQFLAGSLANREEYSQKARALIDKQTAIETIGKTGTERENEFLQATQAKAALTAELAREREDVEKLVTTTLKKETDAQAKIEKDAARDSIELYNLKNNTIEALAAKARQSGAISEVQYQKLLANLKIQELEKRRSITKDAVELQKIDEQIKTQKINNEIAIQKAIDDTAEAEKRKAEATKKAAADQKKADDAKKAEDAAKARRKRGETTVGTGEEISAVGQLREAIISGQAGIEGIDATAAVAGLETLASAFQMVGEAVGQAVEAWVLYGEAGASVRQVTAQILAALAKQAAVKAIYELAEGFAALALAFFGLPNAGPSASAHFASAAIYAGIAGVAAIAGRAVAGNSFQKQTAGATGGAQGMQMQTGAGRNAVTGAYSGQKESAVVDAGINAPWNRPATIVIKDQTGMMGKLLEWEIDTNSRVRSLIVETASA